MNRLLHLVVISLLLLGVALTATAEEKPYAADVQPAASIQTDDGRPHDVFAFGPTPAVAVAIAVAVLVLPILKFALAQQD